MIDFFSSDLVSARNKKEIHQGKTRVWNLERWLMAPENIDMLQQAARMVDPDAVTWRGEIIHGRPRSCHSRDPSEPRRFCAEAFAIEVEFYPLG